MGPSRVLGLLMIALGTALFVAATTDIGGEIVVGMLGVGFLVAYAATRTYGLLIPGSILTGLGTGIVLAEQGAPDGVVVLGLGLGFVTIAVVDVVVGRSGDGETGGARGGWWWPFIPGGILSLVGSTELLDAAPVGRFIAPIVLIVLGGALLLRRRPRPAEPQHRTTVIDDPPRPATSSTQAAPPAQETATAPATEPTPPAPATEPLDTGPPPPPPSAPGRSPRDGGSDQGQGSDHGGGPEGSSPHGRS
jgi:hypothetical protein